ncbi:MAG: TonB-dependent receptor [Muribaculaceae bacterium]|nr:TonB-dependent receptor [Muribaculaceae bacterium]
MKKIYILLLLMASVFTTVAQQLTVSGTVLDETGETFPGVVVFAKDRPGAGTATDADGKFTIKVSKNDVLVFSFVGYEKQEIAITKDESNMVVNMAVSAQMLQETVVVGLGRQRKISTVGAITAVNTKDLQVPATNIQNMLGGRVPGVISIQRSGEPGKNISEFWVRGIGTFGANSSALVLIDGLEGNLSEIDPADIESFSVLKDASATAVYGVRGANGVVLVTTKRGTTDRLQITGRANFTVSHLTHMPEYLGSYEYAKLANEARAVRGNLPLYSDIELDIIKYHLDPDLYPDVNWQKELLHKNSLSQTYFINARGGGSLARYYLSLGTSYESAAYRQDKSSKYSTSVGYRTINYRANLDINLTKTTQLYFGADGFVSIKKEPGNNDTDALWATQRNLTPITIPTKYSTGQLPAYGANNAYSPYVMLNNTGMTNIRHFRGKATLEIKQDLSMLLDGLKLRAQGAYDNSSNLKEIRSILPEMYYASTRKYTGELGIVKRVEAQPATYRHEDEQYYKWHFETTATWDKIIREDHRVGLLAYYYMSSEQTMNGSIDARDATLRSMYAIPIRYQGLSGRITYGFKDTYFMDANFGYTGSENFQAGHRFGFFPSVGLGWVPTSYSWVREKMPWLSFLKIRASYGSVGNDRLTDERFPYLTLMQVSGGGGGWGSTNGYITEERVGADNLRWERAKKADIGIEGKLFNERLEFIIDFFRDRRDGIYQRRSQIPGYVGLMQMPFGNVGKMKSYGSDGNISYRHDFGKDWSLTVRGNFTYSANKVENWEQAEQPYDYQNYTGYVNNAFRGLIALGLFRDEQDVKQSPRQTFGSYMPGDIKYKDVNGDGIIDDDDKVPLSYPNYPKLMYGFGFEARWKQLTLGVLFKGTGNTDYYYVNGTTNGQGYIPFYNGETGNVLSIVADSKNRWIPASYSGDPATENPNALFPRLSYGRNENNTQYSTFWHANSRYLRLQEINLNYHIESGKFFQKLGLKSIDAQFVISNLAVWSPMKLWDPEQAEYNGGAYPIPTSYALQLYLNF